MYSIFQRSLGQQHQQQQVLVGRQPFAQLKRISIAIVVAIMPPLSILVPTHTNVTPDVLSSEVSEIHDELSPDEVHHVCKPLHMLQQLRVLNLHLPGTSPLYWANIQALCGLEHLLWLDIVAGSSDNICSDDIGKLLLALPHLSSMALYL